MRAILPFVYWLFYALLFYTFENIWVFSVDPIVVYFINDNSVIVDKLYQIRINILFAYLNNG